MEANIKVGLKISDDSYDIDVAIPSGKPSVKHPYIFSIQEQGKASDGKPKPENSQLLKVVVGDEDHYYVAVSPPEQVEEWTQGVVTNLEVVVNEGYKLNESGEMVPLISSDNGSEKNSTGDE